MIAIGNRRRLGIKELNPTCREVRMQVAFYLQSYLRAQIIFKLRFQNVRIVNWVYWTDSNVNLTTGKQTNNKTKEQAHV